MRIVGVYNIKGGVGKTATAVNLAALSARDGRRTLVWDLDPQGAATFYFRVKPRVKGGGRGIVDRKRELDALVKATDYDNLDLLPADFSYRKMDLLLDDAKKPTRRLLKLLRPMSAEYDMIFLDCPPSISLVSENIFQAADLLLVPMIPTTLSLRTYDQLLSFLGRHRLKHLELLPFFSMVDQRKRMHQDVMRDFVGSGGELLSARIPYASDVERMGVHRAPVADFAAHGMAGRAYEALWRELEQRLD